MLTLKKARLADCNELHRIQVCSFLPLLETYQDHDTNPAAESIDRVLQRFQQDFTDYYLIMVGEQCVGMMRVCDFGNTCRISPICILPAHQGHGYAQQAMKLAEGRYPNAKKWTLDTILQEEYLCRFYENMGYSRTGKTEHIKEGMDIVYYEKAVQR